MGRQMWVTSDVNLSEALLEAQQEERLVAFVGAGVSAGAPSSLPLFEALARQIAAAAEIPWDDGFKERLDWHLGRWADQGIAVHQLVKSKIAAPGSQPNRLHESIVRLFPTASQLRIVTTNYDTHLTTAAAALFRTDPEVYRAPALPLGRDFNGIVYLHGSVEQPPSSLIVTDRDFGHAYLTDAWAARFLQEMFRKYTVFFIGYSHDDVVMNYLARGLLPDSRARFGFAPNDPPPKWPAFGIEPICYPDANEHAALGDAVSKWADFSRMGLLDHERRITNLVRNPPPEDPPTLSYLERVVSDNATAHLFTRHATGDAWLEWAGSLPLFQRIFLPAGELDGAARELGVWFAHNFVAISQRQGLLTIQQQQGTLHPLVADQAAFALARHPRPDAAIIGRWVPVLLTPGSNAGGGTLSLLLSGSRWPEDKDSALLLLDHLLVPRQTLTPRLSFTSSDERAVDNSISELAGEDYALRQAWDQFFRPHMDELAGPVAAIAGRHLQTAHLILCSAGRASDRWDYSSFDRSGIEPHDQDSPPQPFDLLIDVARDCVAALVEHAPDHAAGIITSWAASTVPLLRRLAVYGYTHRTDISADEKLRWAISRKLLYHISVKHELFLLVEAALPAASATARDELLHEITNGPPDDELVDVSDESRAYVIYNLLHWAVSRAPDFTQAQEALAQLAAERAGFKPREHPDLDVVFSGGPTGPHSPVTVHQVLEMTMSRDVDWMLTYQGEPQPGTWTDRFGLLSVIGEAAAASPGWAVKIAEQLNTKQNWEADLWPVLINGWWFSATTVEADQARAIVMQLNPHQSPYGILLSVIRLLEALAKRQDFTPAVIEEIEEYALKLRDIGLAGDSAGAEPGAADLGTIAGAAINHWAGRLVSFWAQAASTRWQADQDSWNGLLGRTKTALSSLLTMPGFPSLAAAAVMGANVAFLLAADEPWTAGHILPIFDWEDNADRAASAWAGHLTMGQWNPRVAALLWDHFMQSFTRIAPELRQPLAVRVAGFSVYGTADPLDSGLLPKYVSTADEESRQRFACTIDDALQRESTEFAQSQWDRWILRYWRSRLDSIPRPLPVAEAGEMVNWILAAGRHTPDAVALATEGPVQIPSSFRFFRRLKDSPAAEDTASAARLVAHVLSGATDATYACGEIGQVIYLLADRQETETRQDLLDACSHAATHGCPDALTWQHYVESQVT
jgi:SIR2-like domain/Domain of unknown function (DUF4020)